MTYSKHRIGRLSLLFLGLCTIARGEDSAPALPRYQLKPGLEFTVHGTDEFKYENGSLNTSNDYQVWVIRANADGSWRVVIQSKSRMTQKMNGKDVSSGNDDVTLAYCDVFPDGRIITNDSLGYRLDPSVVFPKLPANATEAEGTWVSTDPGQGTRTEFKRASAPPKSDEWAFDAVKSSPMDRIYLSSHRSRFVFDAKRGLIARLENNTAQGYGFNGKGVGNSELTSVSQLDPEKLKAFSAETDRYFAANAAYQDATRKAATAAKDTEPILAQAEKALKEARETLTLPALRDQIDGQLKRHEQLRSYYVEEAKSRAKVLGKPAADWEVKDIAGKSHSLKDYRGKVVILDFWYRGCGWCIRAMPQVKEVADAFKSEPVAVLGMNTDAQDKDAQFVIDEMALNYPTLKAKGVPEKYGVRGFPTLIIIDKEGNVADIHVGYSPHLRQDVSETIKRLLSAR